MGGIRLIAGLGNPGDEYHSTRHNAGFWLVDRLAEQQHESFRRASRFAAEVANVRIGGQSLWLAKPTTFMNRSGRALGALAAFHRIAAADILVVHDELDLPPGQSKLKLGGGAAGHNGLKDIQAQLGTPDFWRLRIGIGHPRNLNLEQEVVDFVLHPPRRDERKLIEDEIARALTMIPDAVAGRMEAAMLKLHTRPRPAAPIASG
jgi:PTH1 family peptidyl-tRNA hydrolase